MFCIKSCLCKILHTVIQGFCKCLDKGTTAGGACFIKLYTVYGLVLDLDTFHILTTDVKNTVYFRIKKCSGIIMRNGLNLALIKKERCLDQRLSITGRTCISNLRIFRKFRINFLNRTDCSLEWASVVVAVERIQKTSVLSYQCSLCRR